MTDKKLKEEELEKVTGGEITVDYYKVMYTVYYEKIDSSFSGRQILMISKKDNTTYIIGEVAQVMDVTKGCGSVQVVELHGVNYNDVNFISRQTYETSGYNIYGRY